VLRGNLPSDPTGGRGGRGPDAPPCYGLISATTRYNINIAMENIDEHAVTIILDSYAEARQALREGRIDAILMLENFHLVETGGENNDIVWQEYMNTPFILAGISTANPELSPFISVIRKAQAAGADLFLTRQYDEGRLDFFRHTLFQRLNARERHYISWSVRNNTPVKVLFNDNYPVTFFDDNQGECQGMTRDILDQVGRLTGLSFICDVENSLRISQTRSAEDQAADFRAILTDGGADMLSGLIRDYDYENDFLWTGRRFNIDKYALFATDKLNFSSQDFAFMRVGLVFTNVYTPVFRKWLQNHWQLKEYPSVENAVNALEYGDIDFLVGGCNMMLQAADLLGQQNLKPVIYLNAPCESSFAFSPRRETLRSIVDKALRLVDFSAVEDFWPRQIADYHATITWSKFPYLMTIFILMGCVLVMLALLLIINRRTSIRLRRTIRLRTEKLKTQTRIAREASRAKTDHLANISHELRTPLNAIIGLGELELRKAMPTDSLQNLEKIHNAGLMLQNIINDILDISKIESGGFTLVPANYSLADVLNDVVYLNIMRIGSKPIAFSLEIDPSIPSRLEGDELRVKQILNNLLSNALKYTEQGSVIFSVGHEPLGNGELMLVFVVSDTGIGIRQDDIQKLFIKYRQVDAKAHRMVEGTGLGLTITRSLVEMMGGSIAVMSEYGKGSVFTVRIRQNIVDNEPIGQETIRRLKDYNFIGNKRDRFKNLIHVFMPYGRVLVVDDNEINLDVAKGMMMPYGLAIDCVVSGRQAINVIQEGSPVYDLILMDHMMPEMDGIETLNAIRKWIDGEYAKNIPIVAMTANAVVGSREMYMANGFQGVITKPIDIMELDAILRKFIRDKQSETTIKRFENDHARIPNDSRLAALILERHIPGVSLLNGLRGFSCNAKHYLNSIRSFVMHTPHLLDRLDQYANDGEIRNYATMVHGIKGSCYSISAVAAGEKALELETAAKDNRIEFIVINHPIFVNLMKKLLLEFDQLLELAENRDEAKPVLAAPAPNPEILAKLLEACKSYDMNAIEAAMAELEGFSYETGGELVPWLRLQLDELEYEKIISRLER
jgi:signal transduction histidine kinase/DNA-binding response OmpR family regulator